MGALLRLERTMNLLEGGKGGKGGWGERVGRGRREGGEGVGIGMFTSNPMIPQYLNNNLT